MVYTVEVLSKQWQNKVTVVVVMVVAERRKQYEMMSATTGIRKVLQ